MNSGHLNSSQINKVHFIGIGGISMSGLAEILVKEGYQVSGSDMKASPTTEKLSKAGITVFTEHSENNISDPDLVVYTAAIKKDNPELIKVLSLNIPTIDRAALLGEIMDKYDYSVAVAGTHGKTTTTSMITSIMITAGVNPTAHIGGILPAINHSTLIGNSNIFITEACEYVESFLKFNPYLAVILNIEADHLDYFSGIEHIKESFTKFANRISSKGFLVANLDDENIVSILPAIPRQIISYGISNTEAIWQGRDISYDEFGCASFTVYQNNVEFMKLTLRVPGIHNVSNALAAIAASVTTSKLVTSTAISTAFQDFKGANRRFELKGFVDGIRVIDDYAHHPTEISATLKAAREGHAKRIISIFQPHTYTRTRALLNDFSNAFEAADLVIITDIYAAREKDPGDINSKMLTDLIVKSGKNAKYISSFNDIVLYLTQNSVTGDLIITMGAGNIDSVADMFVNHKFSEALL